MDLQGLLEKLGLKPDDYDDAAKMEAVIAAQEEKLAKKGSPDDRQKMERIERERDEARSEAKTLGDELAKLKNSDELSEKAKAEIKRIQDESDARIQDLEDKSSKDSLENAIEKALLSWGVSDTKGAKAHIDTGAVKLVDGTLVGMPERDTFARDLPHYFYKDGKKVATGADPADDDVDEDTQLREAAGLKN